MTELAQKHGIASNDIDYIIASISNAGKSKEFENVKNSIRIPKKDLMSEQDKLAEMKKYNLGLDIYYERLTAGNVKELKQNGIAVNCWTVDDKSVAERLISYGVDFITTDILE